MTDLEYWKGEAIKGLALIILMIVVLGIVWLISFWCDSPKPKSEPILGYPKGAVSITEGLTIV